MIVLDLAKLAIGRQIITHNAEIAASASSTAAWWSSACGSGAPLELRANAVAFPSGGDDAQRNRHRCSPAETWMLAAPIVGNVIKMGWEGTGCGGM